MSEIIKKRISESEGKHIKIFLKENNFKFEGKITGFDDDCFEILDYRSSSYKIFKYENINELEVKG